MNDMCSNMASFNTGGQFSIGQVTYKEAMNQKRDMTGLNDRLSNFLNRLREMGQGNQVDPSVYREAMRQLENEIDQLRRMYEDEINKLRRMLDDCCSEKAKFMAMANSTGSSANELENRLTNEIAKNASLSDQIANLQRQLAGRDKDIADLRAALDCCRNDLNMIQPEYNRLKGDSEDCKRRLADENGRRLNLECLVKQLEDKSRFDSGSKDNELADLKARLKAQEDIIRALEMKIKELGRGDGMSLGALLNKMRDATAAELRRMQGETEEALSKALNGMKRQLDEEANAKGGLQRAKLALEDEVRNLTNRLRELEGQLGACMQKNRDLTGMLDQERSNCQAQIRALEDQIQKLKNELCGNIQDANQAREGQMSLRTEINVYKTLVDSGENVLLAQNNMQQNNSPFSGRAQTSYRMERTTPQAACPPANTYNGSSVSAQNRCGGALNYGIQRGTYLPPSRVQDSYPTRPQDSYSAPLVSGQPNLRSSLSTTAPQGGPGYTCANFCTAMQNTSLPKRVSYDYQPELMKMSNMPFPDISPNKQNNYTTIGSKQAFKPHSAFGVL